MVAGDLDNFIVADQFVSSHTGVTHIYLAPIPSEDGEDAPEHVGIAIRERQDKTLLIKLA